MSKGDAGAVRMSVNGSDQTTLRVFALDLPPEAVERFVTQAGTGEWPLKATLGASELREAFVDVVDLRDLGSMTLSDYLSEAHGVRPDALRGSRARLDGLRGHVVLLPGQAFGGRSQELVARAPLRWIGTFEEVRAASGGPRLRAESARGTTSGKPVSNAAMSGRIASFVLLFLFVFVGIIVWIAA